MIENFLPTMVSQWKNWNPYNGWKIERYRKKWIPRSVMQLPSVHMKFPLFAIENLFYLSTILIWYGFHHYFVTNLKISLFKWWKPFDSPKYLIYLMKCWWNFEFLLIWKWLNWPQTAFLLPFNHIQVITLLKIKIELWYLNSLAS